MKRKHLRIRRVARHNPVAPASAWHKAGRRADRRPRPKPLGHDLTGGHRGVAILQRLGPRRRRAGDRSMNRLDPGEGVHSWAR